MVWCLPSCPTASRSLCFPLTRRHFWESVALFDFGVELPRKMSLNWFIPAFVNIRVGSFFTTIGAEGTTMCPLAWKKSRNCCLISLDVFILSFNLFRWFVRTFSAKRPQEGTELAKL